MSRLTLDEIALDLAYERARNRGLASLQKGQAETVQSLEACLTEQTALMLRLDSALRDTERQLDAYRLSTKDLSRENANLKAELIALTAKVSEAEEVQKHLTAHHNEVYAQLGQVDSRQTHSVADAQKTLGKQNAQIKRLDAVVEELQQQVLASGRLVQQSIDGPEAQATLNSGSASLVVQDLVDLKKFIYQQLSLDASEDSLNLLSAQYEDLCQFGAGPIPMPAADLIALYTAVLGLRAPSFRVFEGGPNSGITIAYLWNHLPQHFTKVAISWANPYSVDAVSFLELFQSTEVVAKANLNRVGVDLKKLTVYHTDSTADLIKSIDSQKYDLVNVTQMREDDSATSAVLKLMESRTEIGSLLWLTRPQLKFLHAAENWKRIWRSDHSVICRKVSD